MTSNEIWYGDTTRALQEGTFQIVPYSSSSFNPSGTVAPSAPIILEATSSTDEKQPSSTAIMVGCGLVGWSFAGSWAAVIAAVGGKYAANQKHSPIGEVSRAVGSIASAAGKKAEEQCLLLKVKRMIRSILGVADQKPSPIGDIPRAIGNIASAAGKNGKEECLILEAQSAATNAFIPNNSNGVPKAAQ